MKKNFIFAFKANDLVWTKTFSSVIPCTDYNYFFNVLLPNPNIEKLASVYSIQNTLISIHRTKISSKHLYTVKFLNGRNLADSLWYSDLKMK